MSSHDKRQKRGDDEESTEIIAFGGPMYDEATARKILQEVVLLSEFAQGELTAEELEDADLNFDPDAPNKFYWIDIHWIDDNRSFDRMGLGLLGYATPITYFAAKGDAKMCRYLISRGASTTKCSKDDNPLFPMCAAAKAGHLDICKLLHANGAHDDVRRDDEDGRTSPLNAAAERDHDEVVRWLVLQGALCADANSEEIVGRIFGHICVCLERLAEWGKEVIQTHSALVTFLGGALPPAPDKDQSRTLQCLSGHPGIRKYIGDFVGLEVTKGKHLRILRNVVDTLEWVLAHKAKMDAGEVEADDDVIEME